MDTQKEVKDFDSLSDSIATLIATKHKEIEAKVKQLLGLKEEELERKNKELVEKSTRLESDKEELALREKRFEERRRELEIHVVEIDEDRDRVAEQLGKLESKELLFKARVEEIELKSKDIERRRKELERILEKYEVDMKKLEERNHEIDQKEKKMAKFEVDKKILEERNLEIDRKVKKMEERIKGLDMQSKEMEKQRRELDSDRKKLDERMHKVDKKERQLELDRERVCEDLKKLEERNNKIGQKEKKIDGRIKGLDLQVKDLEKQRREFESDRKKLNGRMHKVEQKERQLELDRERVNADLKKLEDQNHEIDRKEKQIEWKIKGLDLQSMDLEKQRRELESDRKKLDEQMHKVDQKERMLELDRGRVYEDFKVLEYQICEADRRKIELDRGLQQVKLKENLLNMKSKDIDLKRNCNCKEIAMDGKTLQIFLNEFSQNHEKMGDEVSFLLRLSEDPAKLVLDALEGFFHPHLMKPWNGEEFSGHVVQKSCTLLLERLLKISHDIKIKPEVKNEAWRLSSVWITKLKPDSEHSMKILGFLFVLAVYNVASNFSVDEIFNYVKIVAGFEQVPELCCLLGMTNKITGLIQQLVERKQHLVAIRYVYNYNLIQKFPLGSLLKDHVETSKIESAAIIKRGNNSRMAQSQARTRTISNLTAAITCIEKYNISSEYSPANLRQMIASLYNKDGEVEQKEAVVHVPAASIEPKVVVSTEDPLPKRRKLLDGESISMEHEHFKPEKKYVAMRRI